MNPILEMTSDETEPIPLVELKQHLIIFVKNPPGPKSARMVYDTYLRHCGDIFKVYKSTFPYATLDEWNQETKQNFEEEQLPRLRQYADWGYGFSDDKAVDSWLFMFHGFRPNREPDCASFYRFEFDWQVDPGFLRKLTEDVINQVSLLSAYAGYFIQWRPSSNYALASLDRSYAYAMRYWGCEMVDVQKTAKQMNRGYKCVNWLTVIGHALRAKFPTVVESAKSVAYDYFETSSATLLQAAERPLLGDRNRLADLDGYVRIAKALLPLQIMEHEGFGGDRWTDENTMKWIRRFTDSM
jgi:hypothetical protein